MSLLKFKDVFHIPSGRIFLWETEDGYIVESTEMQDVAVDSKEHEEVRKTLEPSIIWRHLVPSADKHLMTVSTQKGCVHNCQFCDVAPLPFKGNLTEAEIMCQIDNMLSVTPQFMYGGEFKKMKIGFARMGEPAHNLENVLSAMLEMMKRYRKINWLPCFNTILPTQVNGSSGLEVLDRVIDFKEDVYNGFLHLQISANSTCEEKRAELFGASVVSLEDIIDWIRDRHISNRTVTLNFIVMKGVEIDVQKLRKMGMTGDKFAVKLIPLNNTQNSGVHGLHTFGNHSNYEAMISLTQEFKDAGIPVVMDTVARCEESGSICCGQLAQIAMKG